MSNLAKRITWDVDTGALYVDGTEFPWAYINAEPTLEQVGEDLLPAVTVTIPAGHMETISAKAAPDGQVQA